MPAIDDLMRKLGYVRLSAFGLVLTPEGRVLSMRPAVLDDGIGGKIVGWKDDDLAAAELEKWGAAQPPQPARPAPKAAVATRVAPALDLRVRETSMPVSVAPIPTLMKPAAPPRPVARIVNVAPPPPPEEDDWEWTIAIARARAAAEDAEQAAAAARIPAPPKFSPAKTLPIAKIAADPARREIAKIAADPALDTDNWPKTEPLHTLDPDDFQQEVATEVVRIVKAVHTPRVVLAAKPTPPQAMPVVKPPPSAQRAFDRARSPATVIPIPKFPKVAKTLTGSDVEPVVRAPVTPIAPRPRPARFAKGTSPYVPKTGEVPTIVEPEPPPLLPGGDDTVPGMVLPPVARRASRA